MLIKHERYHPFQYMCAQDDWGSLTLRSIIEDMEDDGVGLALIAYSLECGRVLREIAKIARIRGYVWLASHVRERPNAQRTRELGRGRSAIPEKYLPLSEIQVASDSPSRLDEEDFLHIQAFLQSDTDEEHQPGSVVRRLLRSDTDEEA